MKTELLKMKGDWCEIVDDCRSTVSKPPLGREPSADFKQRILIAEHSPIRDISFRWKWTGIKYWIAMHWKTHHWESKVSTQRTDRTGVDRNKLPQDAPVDFVGEANVQHLIDTMRKRLCYQASPETREYAEDLKQAITEVQPEIGSVLVPNCVYRCGCCELRSCGLYERLCKDFPEVRSSNIAERYAAYNRYFEGIQRKQEERTVKNYCKSCIHDDDIGFCDKCWYNHLLEERNLPPTEYEEEKKITNYYSLIHKSHEELAHWLVERVTDSPWCKPDAPVDPVTKQCEVWDCEKCALEWLKQEETTSNV